MKSIKILFVVLMLSPVFSHALAPGTPDSPYFPWHNQWQTSLNAIWRPLPQAIMTNNVDGVEEALKNSPAQEDINMGLIVAVKNCNPKIVKLLVLEGKADCSFKDGEDKTALDHAKASNCIDAQDIIAILESARK